MNNNQLLETISATVRWIGDQKQRETNNTVSDKNKELLINLEKLGNEIPTCGEYNTQSCVIKYGKR